MAKGSALKKRKKKGSERLWPSVAIGKTGFGAAPHELQSWLGRLAGHGRRACSRTWLHGGSGVNELQRGVPVPVPVCF